MCVCLRVYVSTSVSHPFPKTLNIFFSLFSGDLMFGLWKILSVLLAWLAVSTHTAKKKRIDFNSFFQFEKKNGFPSFYLRRIKEINHTQREQAPKINLQSSNLASVFFIHPCSVLLVGIGVVALSLVLFFVQVSLSLSRFCFGCLWLLLPPLFRWILRPITCFCARDTTQYWFWCNGFGRSVFSFHSNHVLRQGDWENEQLDTLNTEAAIQLFTQLETIFLQRTRLN